MKRILFYPCCGGDVHESIRAWQHIIDEFWFAEIGYNPGSRLKAHDQAGDITWRTPNIRLNNAEIKSQSEYFLRTDKGGLVPVKSLTYFFNHLKRSININFAGGCAVAAFNCLTSNNISVFVNRGDHRVNGEASSGICWLDDEGSSDHPEGMLRQVLSKMSIGSFIVTDGSNATKALAPYWLDYDYPVDAHLNTELISLHGMTLRCVGMLEPQYGPTLIWQIIAGSYGADETDIVR